VAAEVKRRAELIEHGATPDDALFVDAHAAGEARLSELERAKAEGKSLGVKCGLRCIDKRLGGLLPDSLIVMAGRPGMGKTALLGNVMARAARFNPDRLFAAFSLEMGADQLSDRALSRLTADEDELIPYERLTKGFATPMELHALQRLRHRLPRNLLIRDRAGLTLEATSRAVWWLKRKGDLAAIGIDYLQIMRRPKAEGRNDAAVLGEMTAGLKTLAREARIAIILLSQLSRAVEMRDDKRPQLSDLRESGSIEQDADAVLFPFREGYYLERAEPREGTKEHREWVSDCEELRPRLDVINAKNRHGNIGSERQTYNPSIDLITNWDPT
jgi:replicative DNA helicase